MSPCSHVNDELSGTDVHNLLLMRRKKGTREQNTFSRNSSSSSSKDGGGAEGGGMTLTTSTAASATGLLNDVVGTVNNKNGSCSHSAKVMGTVMTML